MAKNLWKNTHVNAEMQEVARANILSVMQNLRSQMTKCNLEFMVLVWWVIWHARNKLIFEGKKLSLLILMAKATAVVEAFQRIHGKEQMNIENSEVKKQDQWYPPPIGYYKVNVEWWLT